METVIRLRFNYNTAHFVFCNSLNKCFLCCRYLNTSKIWFVTKSLLPSWYKTPAEEARWPTPTSWRQIRENNKILSEAVLARPQDSHEVHWLAAAAVSAGQARAEEGDQRLLPRPRPQVGEPQQLPPPRPGQPPQQAQPLALPRARGLLADLARHGETLAQVDEDKEWRCDLQQQRSQQQRGPRRRQWLRWVSNCTANALYSPDICDINIVNHCREVSLDQNLLRDGRRKREMRFSRPLLPTWWTFMSSVISHHVLSRVWVTYFYSSTRIGNTSTDPRLTSLLHTAGAGTHTTD